MTYEGLIQPALWLIAFAAVASFVVGAMRAGKQAAPKDEVDVLLVAAGAAKIHAIKEVRGITGMGLKEAKDAVDTVPSRILVGVPADVAERARTVLVGIGATVELKSSPIASPRNYWRRAVVAAIAALVVVPAIGVVPPGHRGVVYAMGGGVSESERPEGVTLLLPWFQHMTTFNVRTQKVYSDQVFAQSADLQEITVVASVNYHVDPSRAAELYRDVGADYQTTVIEPAMFQRVKAAVGQVRAVDFAENREQLALEVRDQLAAQLDGYGIVVEYVNVEDAIFDPAFITAVKEKVIADEEAAEQQRLVAAERHKKAQAILQAEARARSVEIEADAQARANRQIAQSLTSDMLRWQWLVRWDGILPTTLVGDDAALLIDGRATGVQE